jgi:hypothetical protein
MNRTHFILALFGLIFLSCSNIQIIDDSVRSNYSKYSFNILDSTINKKPYLIIELFGEKTKCVNYLDTFRISNGFIDSIPVNSFENNLEFISNPKLILAVNKSLELQVMGFMVNNHFNLTIKKSESKKNEVNSGFLKESKRDKVDSLDPNIFDSVSERINDFWK